MLTPIDIVPVQNTLGEGIVWDGRRAWWTDIQEKRLFRYDPATRALETFDLPERLGSFGLIEGDERIVAAFESGFAFYEPHDGALAWIARPPHDAANVRFNDGRVDRQGRFWAGSMVEGDGAPRGKLYRLDADGRYEICVTNVAISNSLCFSPDGHSLYFADTPQRQIWRFRLDPVSGALSERSVFARTPPGAFPDGANVDSEGCVWSAHWGAGQIVRYDPRGRIERTIQLPVTQPTCVAFGGDKLDHLFVTTARENLDKAAIEQQPLAGAMFVFAVGVTGLPEPRFRQGQARHEWRATLPNGPRK